MTTAESPVSESKKKWDGIEETAEDITSEQNEDFEEIKNILERREEYIDNHLNKIEGEICTLKEKQCCLKAVGKEAKKLIDLIRLQCNEEENNRLIEELGNKIESCTTVKMTNPETGPTAPTLVTPGSRIGLKILPGSRIGQKIRRCFGPSERKVNSIKEWTRGNLMVIKTQCEKLNEPASEGIRMIAEDLLEIEKEKDRLSGEKSRLSKEFSQLKKWSRKRTKSTERLQKVQDEFNKLKLGLRGKNTVSLEDQTENQSPVQPKDQEH